MAADRLVTAMMLTPAKIRNTISWIGKRRRDHEDQRGSMKPAIRATTATR